ncbi:HNH endonuclease [Streptosporangium sp. NPDC050280]|uniref:HNH endonuclease n=1 Tax=unclassified Streptosporangium TaxID=2632669 RepID=UPI003438C5DB
MVRGKYETWFILGARTLSSLLREHGLIQGVFSDSKDWYLCPLCIDMTMTIEEIRTKRLSPEHLPPKSLGGREVLLTCKKCNNDAGGRFDGEAFKQHQMMQFLKGGVEHSEVALLTAAGIEVRTRMRVLADLRIQLTLAHDINAPGRTEALIDHLRDVIREKRETNISIKPVIRFSPERARVSWMRTAYLAAFAVFGWRYILRSNFQSLRDHLKDPRCPAPPIVSATDPSWEGLRELWLIQHPSEHRSLLVIADGHGVFLPLPGDRRTLEELAQGLDIQPGQTRGYKYDYLPIIWPTGPLHLLDPRPSIL